MDHLGHPFPHLRSHTPNAGGAFFVFCVRYGEGPPPLPRSRALWIFVLRPTRPHTGPILKDARSRTQYNSNSTYLQHVPQSMCLSTLFWGGGILLFFYQFFIFGWGSYRLIKFSCRAGIAPRLSRYFICHFVLCVVFFLKCFIRM